MSKTFATQQPHAASLISHTFLFVRCAMLLSSPLSFTPPVSATPFLHLDNGTDRALQIATAFHFEQHGSHGAWIPVNE